MKVELLEHVCIVTRELGDKRPKHDLIKKLMWKDGHMVSDWVHYLRSRNQQNPSIAIYDGNYAIFDSCKMYNEDGRFAFDVARNI